MLFYRRRAFGFVRGLVSEPRVMGTLSEPLRTRGAALGQAFLLGFVGLTHMGEQQRISSLERGCTTMGVFFSRGR